MRLELTFELILCIFFHSSKVAERSHGSFSPPFPLFQYTDQTYIISKKAEAILSTVLADILEESLEDARNLAETAGKSSVTQREMEMSLRNLCLRLSRMPANVARFDYWNDDDGDKNNNGPSASSKVGRTKKDK